MSRIKASIPVDAEASAKEADRRESLKVDGAYQRGVAQAQATALYNARIEVDSRRADLKKCTLKRDFSVAARDAYNRCHASLVKAAERLAGITGEGVAIPEWLPPPTEVEQPVTIVRPPKFDLGQYTERAGRGPSGKGLPISGPGSNVDPEWADQ